MKKVKLLAFMIIICINLVGCNNSDVSNPGELNSGISNPEVTNNETVETNKITTDQAKEIALKHAELTEDQVSFITTKSEFDDGIEKYNIEFYYNNKEYDYEINAANGQIIKYDLDDNNKDNSQSDFNNTAKISMEQAKEIVLKHMNLTSDQVTFAKVELDFDNGIQKYDVEFYYDNREYSYEIDANTGNILAYEQD